MADYANVAAITAEEALVQWNSWKGHIADKRSARFSDNAPGQQVREFWDFMEKQTPWMTAPASTYHHMCVPHGLLIHSVLVARTAMKFRDAVCPTLEEDSVLLCGLFHDAGKIWGSTGEGDVILPRYMDAPDLKNGGRPAKPYFVNDPTAMDVAVRSLRLVEKFIDLTDAEAQAIHGHDHQYIPANRSYQHKETPLLLITHYADFWVGHCYEGGIQDNDQNRWRFAP